VFCYADDLVVANGHGWMETRSRADEALATVVRSLGNWDWRWFQKTEAMSCGSLRKAPPHNTNVLVSNVLDPVELTMKYLGLTMDSKWSFIAHFEQLIPRVEKAANVLSRLLPNIRVRRLFMNVVQSIALYAAPVWAAEMEATSPHTNAHA